MRVELINTGSELLLGFTVNTHANYIARQLSDIGLRLVRQTTVADDRAEMRATVAEALGRSDIVLITGGLGPTSDDFTRDVVAELLGRAMYRDESVVTAITERFRTRGLALREQILVQAQVPAGAQVLANPHGTAPGLFLEYTGKQIFLLPGPPRELYPMFETQVVPRLPRRAQLDCRVFKVACLPESVIEHAVAPVLADLPRSERGEPELELGYCARMGEVEVRIIAAPAIAAEAERRIRAALGDNIFGTHNDRLEEVVVNLLTAAGQTVATAESCTGGLIANRLTNVSGASAVFPVGYVTYSNESKMRLLGVRDDTLKTHGAVSEEACRQMAEGARQRSGVDYAVSATGIAGPTGGTAEKPVGLVFIGLATPTGTLVTRHHLLLDRETFKQLVSQYALDAVRRALLAVTGGGLGQPALPKSSVGRAGPSAPSEQTKTVVQVPVGRAGPTAPRPRRKVISHEVPFGVRPDEAVFFLTLCSRPRGVNQLCRPDIAPQLLESIAFRHQRGDWWVHLALLMPDHLHVLVSFPGEKNMPEVIGEWKKFAARTLGVQWQRSFFEHRLRQADSLRAKEDYIRQNPVRAGLVARAEDWRFVWAAAG